MKCRIIYILLFLLSLGCGQKQNTKWVEASIKLYPVDPSKAEKIYASAIFDSIVYIPLESSNEVVVGEISKLEIVDSLFYILDTKAKTIWCFNQKGKYINKIAKRGQGPGEYVSLFDFTVDRVNNHILVLDRSLRKILTYDFSGRFVKNERIEVHANKFGILNDNKILAYTRGTDMFLKKNDGTLGYNFFIIDSTGKTDAYFPYIHSIDNIITNKAIEINDGKVFVNYAGHDTIYEFSMDGNILLKHVIDFGDYHLPIENVSNESVAIDLRNSPKYAKLDEVYYSNDYSLIIYDFESRLRFALRNNKTGKSSNGSFLENDIDFISLANPAPIKIQRNKLFYIKEAEFVIQQKHEKKPAYLNIPALSTLKEDDNPVIMIGYLK
jgi:hypothetical protein